MAKEIKTILTVPTFWAKIYISGPLTSVENFLRKECFDEGLCVTVNSTKFIYTGGEEYGVEIGLINYPRFPTSDLKIKSRALDIAENLLKETFQNSVLVMTPDETCWMSLRD